MEEIIKSISKNTTIYIGYSKTSFDFLQKARQLFFESDDVVDVKKTIDGAPYFVDNSICVSLSHKDGLYVAALSRTPIGVDVEKIKQFDYKKISKRFFNKVFDTERDFFEYWTKSEALAKKHGKGLLPIKDYEGTVTYYQYGDYLIALAE